MDDEFDENFNDEEILSEWDDSWKELPYSGYERRRNFKKIKKPLENLRTTRNYTDSRWRDDGIFSMIIPTETQNQRTQTKNDTSNLSSSWIGELHSLSKKLYEELNNAVNSFQHFPDKNLLDINNLSALQAQSGSVKLAELLDVSKEKDVLTIEDILRHMKNKDADLPEPVRSIVLKSMINRVEELEKRLQFIQGISKDIEHIVALTEEIINLEDKVKTVRNVQSYYKPTKTESLVAIWKEPNNESDHLNVKHGSNKIAIVKEIHDKQIDAQFARKATYKMLTTSKPVKENKAVQTTMNEKADNDVATKTAPSQNVKIFEMKDYRDAMDNILFRPKPEITKEDPPSKFRFDFKDYNNKQFKSRESHTAEDEKVKDFHVRSKDKIFDKSKTELFPPSSDVYNLSEDNGIKGTPVLSNNNNDLSKHDAHFDDHIVHVDQGSLSDNADIDREHVHEHDLNGLQNITSIKSTPGIGVRSPSLRWRQDEAKIRKLLECRRKLTYSSSESSSDEGIGVKPYSNDGTPVKKVDNDDLSKDGRQDLVQKNVVPDDRGTRTDKPIGNKVSPAHAVVDGSGSSAKSDVWHISDIEDDRETAKRD